MAKGRLFSFLAGLFLGATALMLTPKTVDAQTFRGFIHNSENGIPGANTSVKAYLKRTGGTIDTLYLTTNSTGRYNYDATNFVPSASIGDITYVEAKKDTLGKSFTVKTEKTVQNGNVDLYELTLDNPDKNVRAFTWNIDEFKDTTNFANTTIVPSFWLNKNPDQKITASLDTISSGLTSHPHYFDSWGNFEKQDSTWAQGDSARVLFAKRDTNKAFPDSIPYSLFTFGIDTTMGDAQLVRDTLKFPTNVSIKDWNIDSLFTTTAVGDSVEPKAFVQNNRESLLQYNFPDSAKFYLTITGPGVNYSDSLVKRLDSGMEDTLTFKKAYKGDGNCTLRCSTSTFGDATPTNNVKQWITSGPMAVEMGYFGAMPFDKGIKLEWITNSEYNTYQWAVFRGADHDTLRWDAVGTKPGQGTTYQTTNYFYDDTMPKAGVWNYKLKETDMSGEETWYGPVSATAGMAGARSPGKFKTYPNPIRNLRNVKIDKAGIYDVYNITGQNIGTIECNVSGATSYNFSEPTATGIYLLRSKGTKDVKRVDVLK